MKLAIWAIGAVFVLSGIVFWVMTHPNRDRANVMAEELAALKKQNDDLRETNAVLARDVEALRNDPRVAARRAREIAPFAAPNETIYQFKRPEESKEIEVLVKMNKDGLHVAGHPATLAQLNDRLLETQQSLGRATFKLEHDKSVDGETLDQAKTIVDRVNARTQ